MNTLVIIAITLLVAYTIILCVVNKHIPDSLSQSVFFLPQSASWIWTVVIGFVGFAVMPAIIEKTPINWQSLAFIACFGLLLVAVAPLLPNKESEGGIDTSDLAYKVHMIGAFTCAIGSQVLIAICQWWLLFGWIPWLAAMAYTINVNLAPWRTKVFWAEMTCFAITFAYVLI